MPLDPGLVGTVGAYGGILGILLFLTLLGGGWLWWQELKLRREEKAQRAEFDKELTGRCDKFFTDILDRLDKFALADAEIVKNQVIIIDGIKASADVNRIVAELRGAQHDRSS